MDITVIVPVYNVEKYIEKCIESLKIQKTTCCYEIIIVDDGSTDASSNIVDKYKCDNVTIIHTKNRGVSAARNTGINKATGEYITFVDGDDYVSQNYLESLYCQIKNDNAEFSIQRYNTIYPNYYTKQAEVFNLLKESTDGINYIDYHILNGGDTSCCAKIYKTEFLNKYNIRFPENITNLEDMYFLFYASIYANKITYKNNSNYWRIARYDGVSFSKFNKKKLSAIKVFQQIELKLVEINAADKLIMKTKAMSYHNIIYFMLEMDVNSIEYKSLRNKVSTIKYWSNKYVNKKDIIKYLILILLPNFSHYMYTIYKKRIIMKWKK